MIQSRGFTLGELLVVVAIIVLLVAMIMPSLDTGSHVRRVLCINNLNKINQTSHVWAQQAKTWNQNALAEGGWTAIVNNLTGSLEVLKCPEEGPMSTGASVESMIVIRQGPGSNICIPLIEMNANGGFAGAFKILKFSGTQFANTGEGRRITPEPYKEDGNPRVYYWCYDDGGIGSGDYDFQDLTIKVTKNYDGTVTIFVRAETGGDPEVWSPDLKIEYADTKDINAHHHGGKGVEKVFKVGSVTNYGMNNAKIEMREVAKLQILDYPDVVAKSIDNWDKTEWDVNKDLKPDFIRHRGKLNAALLDGSAKTYPRWKLDPSDLDVERELWQK